MTPACAAPGAFFFTVVLADRGRDCWSRGAPVRDEVDYAAHVAYCHFYPVKHGEVARPEDWPYSSVHREIREGRWGA